jgi:ABC-type dipeptide/oligopeptide/nickel transport system permease subunit
MGEPAAQSSASPPRPSGLSRLSTRLAIVLGVLFLAAGVLMTFLPSSTAAAEKCGTWVHPEWSKAKSASMASQWGELAEKFDALNASDQAAAAQANSASSVAAYVTCTDELGSRRTWSLVLIGLAIALPIGVVFVAGRRPA